MKLTSSGLVMNLINVMIFPPFCLMKCLHEVNPPVTSKQWMETIPSLALEDTSSSEHPWSKWSDGFMTEWGSVFKMCPKALVLCAVFLFILYQTNISVDFRRNRWIYLTASSFPQSSIFATIYIQAQTDLMTRLALVNAQAPHLEYCIEFQGPQHKTEMDLLSQV